MKKFSYPKRDFPQVNAIQPMMRDRLESFQVLASFFQAAIRKKFCSRKYSRIGAEIVRDNLAVCRPSFKSKSAASRKRIVYKVALVAKSGNQRSSHRGLCLPYIG